MKIVNAGYKIMTPLDGENVKRILKSIEEYGRVCYKSEDKITHDSAGKFIHNIISNGHESVLEHESITVKFIVDRGISHEMVRHRLASYSQESTRYISYGNKYGEITVIKPCYFPASDPSYMVWHNCCEEAERAYLKLLKCGASPQEARSVLPTSLKTELIMTANVREWRHFFKLRTTKAAHPQMREVAVPLLHELQSRIPIIFDDIEVKEV